MLGEMSGPVRCTQGHDFGCMPLAGHGKCPGLLVNLLLWQSPTIMTEKYGVLHFFFLSWLHQKSKYNTLNYIVYKFCQTFHTTDPGVTLVIHCTKLLIYLVKWTLLHYKAACRSNSKNRILKFVRIKDMFYILLLEIPVLSLKKAGHIFVIPKV